MSDQLRRIKHLSASAINDFVTCPLLWYGRRIARWPEPPSADLAMGRALHAAFAAHHSGGDAELELLRAWRDVAAIGPVNGSLARAVDALRLYRTSMPPADGDRTEAYFRVAVPGLDVPLIGYFDLLRRDEVHEFKTGRARWGQKKVDGELQATAYWWAYTAMTGRPPARLVYTLVTTYPAVAVYPLETTRTPEQLGQFEALARRIHGEMRHGKLIGKCRPGRCCFPQQCRQFPNRLGDETKSDMGPNVPEIILDGVVK
jgi:CRISPR/Cas system-associated exonuclease Cas4 (RecB family)